MFEGFSFVLFVVGFVLFLLNLTFLTPTKKLDVLVFQKKLNPYSVSEKLQALPLVGYCYARNFF